MALVKTISAGGHAAYNSNPIAIPGDIVVQREELTTSTFLVRLKNERISLSGTTRPPQTYTYMVAGSSGQLPTVTTGNARYLHFINGMLVGHCNSTPSTESGVPQQVTVIADIGQFRQFHVYALTVSVTIPGIPHDSTEDIWMMDSLDLHIDLGDPPKASDSDHVARGEFGKDYATSTSLPGLGTAQLLNPDINQAYYELPQVPDLDRLVEWSKLLHDSQLKDHLFKLSVYEAGVYKVETSDLQQLTSAPLPAPANWRVFYDGKEIPTLESNVPNGMAFVARNFDKAVFGSDTYWLAATTPTLAMSAPLRLQKLAASDLADAVELTSVSMTVTAEKYGDFQPKLIPNADVTQWYWQAIANRKTVPFEVTLPSGFVAKPSSNVEIGIYYGYALPQRLQPHLELFTNGFSGGLTTSTLQQGSMVFKVPSENLKPGLNEFALRLTYPVDSSEAQEVYIQKIVLKWYQPLGRTLFSGSAFSIDAAGTASRHIVTAIPAEERDGVVVGIAPDNKAHLLPSRIQNGNRTYLDQRGCQYYFAVSPQQAERPPHIEAVNDGQPLVDESLASQYTLIIPRQLLSTIEPLVQRRREEGLLVSPVAVEDIFNEFSFGRRDWEGIRQFLLYAVSRWSAPKLQYVTLVGESSTYRGPEDQAPSTTQFDMVPIAASPRASTPHGDQGYSTVCGRDNIADLAVSRISISNAEELTSAVEKILRYEDSPPGLWTTKAEFVIDDNDEFRHIVDDVIERAAAAPSVVGRLRQWDYPYVPNARVSYRKRSREATEELLRRINEGRSMINFFGHGGPNLWSHERLFHLSDLSLLQNAPQLPMITCASCDNAWLDYPVMPVRGSMGEILVKESHGGAISLFGPVSGASPYEHSTLVRRLMEAIWRQGVMHIGEATMYAKNLYFAETRSSSIPDQYVLVGDSAMKLKIPRITASLMVTPSTMLSEVAQTVRVQYHGEEPAFDGTLTVTDEQGENIIKSVPFSAQAGLAELQLPPLLPGNYVVTLHQVSSEEMQSHVAQLTIVDPRLSVIAEESSATIPARRLRIFNPWNLDHSEVQVSIQGPGSNIRPALIAEKLIIPPHQEISVPLDDNVTSGYCRVEVISRALNAQHLTNADVFVPAAVHRHGYELYCYDFGTNPSPPVGGAPMTVTLAATNTGTSSSPDLIFILSNDHKQLSLPVPVNSIAPAMTRRVALQLTDTLSSGVQRCRVEVREANATTAPAIQTFPVELYLRDLPDVGFVPGSARAEAADSLFLQHKTVFLHARILNYGESVIQNLPLEAMVGDPETGKPGETINDTNRVIIKELKPGEMKEVMFRLESPVSEGSQQVWLLLNKARSLKERNFENNIIPVPPFQVHRLGNLILKDLGISSKVAGAGDNLTFTMNHQDDGQESRGPVEIEYGFKNRLTYDSVSSRSLIQVSQTPTTFTATMAVNPEFNIAYARINSNLEFEEISPDDNAVSTDFELIIPASSLATTESRNGILSYSETLKVATARNIEWLGGNRVRVADRLTSSVVETLGSQHYVSGNVQMKYQDNLKTDNKWNLWAFEARAHPGEKAGDLELQLPGASTEPGILHDVYLHIVTAHNYEGGRAGDFEARIEDEPDFKKYTFSHLNQGEYPARCYLGRYNLNDPKLDITLRKSDQDAAKFVYYELVPVKASLTSPITLFNDEINISDRTGMLNFDIENTTGSSVTCYWRTADAVSSDGLEQGTWNQIENGTEVTLRKYGQWRIDIRPTPGSQPIINNVYLELK